MAISGAGTSERDGVAALDVGDYDKMPSKGLPNQADVLFIERMMWIRNGD